MASGCWELEESVHGSVGWFGQREKEIGDPGGRMIHVLSDDWSVGVGDLATQDCNDVVIDLILAEMTKGLDERATLPAGRGHIPRGGVLEMDLPAANLDLAGGTVGEENNAGRDLFGQSQHIGGIRAGRLKADSIPHDQRTSDGIRGGSHCAEHGVMDGVIIEAPGKLADGACDLESAQSGFDGSTAAEVLKMLWREYPTLSVAINAATNLRINGLRFKKHFVSDGKSRWFFRQSKD